MKITILFATVSAALLCAINSQAYIVTGGPGSIAQPQHYKVALNEKANAYTISFVPTNSFWNGINEISDAVANSTGWSVLGGGGHSVTGSKSIAFAQLDYQFNGPVGLVLGYDYLWAPKWAKAQDNGHSTQLEAVNGGVTFSAQIHPFAFIGSTFLTNVVVSPFAAEKLATPKNGNAIGALTDAGFTYDFVQLGNFEFSGAAIYENRSGQGYWDGNFGMVSLMFTRLF